MIKRIIFDIDNTLIPWKEEYNQEINNTLEKLNIQYTAEEAKQIAKAFDEYDNVYFTFKKDKMVEFINQYTGKEYPKELVYGVIKGWEGCAPENVAPEIMELLKYLKEKYELVILTDWYVDSQIVRLDKAGILNFFQKIYGAEATRRKPFPDAFLQAIGNNKPEECVMIGDDFERDIKGAIQAGLNAVYYCPNDNGLNVDAIKIKKLEEIKNIF